MAGSYVPPNQAPPPAAGQPLVHIQLRPAASECFSFSPAAGERPPPDGANPAARLVQQCAQGATPPNPGGVVSEVFSFSAPAAERPGAPAEAGD